MGELYFFFILYDYFSCGEAKKFPWRLEAADALLLLPNLRIGRDRWQHLEISKSYFCQRKRQNWCDQVCMFEVFSVRH